MTNQTNTSRLESNKLRDALKRIIERCRAFIDDEADMRTDSVEVLMAIAEDALSQQAEPVEPAPAQDEPPQSGITIEKDVFGTVHIKLGDFDYIQIQYQYPYTDNASQNALAKRIAELLTRPAQTEQQAEPAPALSYKDDPRTPVELSNAGCRCVRFGEGNPHWPCRIHAAPAQDERECCCPKIGEPWNPEKHGRDCPAHQAARPAQTEPQPIGVTAVAITRENEDGELYLDWLLEGGIAELEFAGQVLVVAEKPITDDEGSGEVYAAPIAQAAPQPEQSQAVADVLAERRRQVEAEGWTPAHDDLYCAAELPRAAAAYILNGANDEAPYIWPFSAKWWKPRDVRANYVRAGALILAEIERIDRAARGGEA